MAITAERKGELIREFANEGRPRLLEPRQAALGIGEPHGLVPEPRGAVGPVVRSSVE